MRVSLPSRKIKDLVTASLCLVLCMVLPFLTGQIPQVGRMLCPMHFPVILCGFLCGWPYGLFVGLVAPALRFLLFGMPPIFPEGVCMMAELAIYGLASALLYRALPKKYGYLYIALILSMVLGRAAWAAVRLVLMGLTDLSLTWPVLWSSIFLGSIPGIIAQIILLPPVIRLLRRRDY